MLSPPSTGACYGGVDDGFFRRCWPRSLAVLAVHCSRGGDLCPCGLLHGFFTVDGLDATEVIVGLVRAAQRRGYRLRALLLDTVVYAGFNVAEPWRIHGETRVPVIVVYWYPPRRGAVERALRLHFRDWRRRLEVLERVWGDLREVPCPRGGLLVAGYGVDPGEAWRIVCGLQLFTRHPEPLYTAHTVASELSARLMGSDC